jgi:hypothetical protein
MSNCKVTKIPTGPQEAAARTKKGRLAGGLSAASEKIDQRE